MSRPHQQRLEAITDLTTLSPLSDDAIVSTLRERFLSDQPYTSLGSNTLVAVNPHKYVACNSDSVLQEYAAEYRSTDGQGGRAGGKELGPHVFRLANDAYYNMRRTGQDQSVVFSGEQASGKSHLRRLALSSILTLSLSSPGKKGSKLSTQIPSADFILESFGNARTLFNPSASRFGRYSEMQFNERGRVCGIKTLDYYLEKGRVGNVGSGERSFHIFYYLVAGASPDERAHLHLVQNAPYRYLGSTGGRMAVSKEEDARHFDTLKLALKSVGLSKRHVAQTCQLTACILHLGNLEFITDRHRNEDAAVVRNLDVLAICAEFLGVPAHALESVLSYKTKMVKRELCTVFLDPDGASDNRDDLARLLYSLLFAWLNESINQKLCADEASFSTFISLLDLPGPQNSTARPNSLDQFAINLANEKLQRHVQWVIHERNQPEFEEEGISPRWVGKVPFFDNAECLRVLTNRPGGLVHIIDDQSRRAPRKTDGSMVEAFQKRWGNHSSFRSSSGGGALPTFTVNHYNGPVTYSAEGFLEKNADAVNPDFVSLLRGGSSSAHVQAGQEGGGSANPFVKDLFKNGKVIETRVSPRDEETIVGAKQSARPMRAPSTRRKGGTIKRVGTTRKSGEDEEDGEDGEGDGKEGGAGKGMGVCGTFREALDTLFATLSTPETQPWLVICINPNDSQLPNQLEGRSVKGQVRSAGLSEIARRAGIVYEVGMTPEEFVGRYRVPLEEELGAQVLAGEDRESVENARKGLGLDEWDVVLGATKVYLTHAAFRKLEDMLRARDADEVKRNQQAAAGGFVTPGLVDPYSPAPYGQEERANSGSPNQHLNSPYAYGEPSGSPFDTGSNQALPLVANASRGGAGGIYDDDVWDEAKSEFDPSSGHRPFASQRDDSVSQFGGSESYAPSRNMFQSADKLLAGGAGKETPLLAGEAQEGETAEVVKESSARRRWVALCWILTFWVPNPLLRWVGGMKRLDVRQAWREKLALNMVIWFVCGCAIFIIAVLGLVICPTEHVFSTNELASHSETLNPNNVFTSIRGEVFDLTSVAATHSRIVGVVPTKSILKYGGVSSDNIFPVQVSALCNGVTGSVSPYVTLDSSNNTDTNAQYHDFRAFTSDSRPDWYFESMVEMRWTARVGFLGYTPKELKNMASSGKSVGVYDGLVYDVSSYINNGPGVGNPTGMQAPQVNTQFMSSEVLDVFKFNSGNDVTKQLNALQLGDNVLGWQKICLRNLFLIGKVDNRNSPQCLFSTYILLALSIMMISIIGFKFLASINFSSARAPEDHDKFVICQVPCYTEGDSSLRKTIDSLAKMKYDDKRKLLLVICDGMIVGSGNDRPTPRIVLDILGADPNLDPEPLSFLSLGDGAKQHNMGKVYSGLYEVSGHVVPYLVVVKVGKPTERSRPGNRGKRDSQMLVMHFLNKVHFNAPMNPLELEMYHQIKNVIGVNPTFYEYLLTVDADTTVDPMSVNRLISAMIHDKKLLGACGETELANAKQSIITMMQVYEYFISHHMAKAFESLFGSVTCLPGCFTLFRLRTPDTHKPLLISNQLIHDYSENRVDTLHMKNLLHLGEDRYLTTLLLKHFPNFKTQFVRDAHAYTVAPDDWKVLLSQRRRWINSTVHNLGELIFLDQLCGFCCFSMRFIVMIDLLSTLIQPVTVAYIVYLIVLVAGEHKSIPTLSLIMIAAVYGLQALVFIIRRKWDMIGWMFFYILAIPAFSLFLPLYSFWKMDDFSWGATRVVLGESGKKMIVHDEGKFDPRVIPLKSWNDYENELWDKESNHSIGSWVPPAKHDPYAASQTASIYGRETYYDPRGHSPSPSQAGFGLPPPGYQSGRATPLSQVHMLPSFGDMAAFHQPSPPPSRPATNYLDVNIPSSGSPEPLSAFSGPSDSLLDQAIQNLLRNADLNSVTKRGVRKNLEEHFGVDLTAKKATINAMIDRVLLSRAG